MCRQVALSWRPTRCGEIPDRAIILGSSVHIGRAKHENEVIPGTGIHGQLYVPYCGEEHCHEDYEVLCDTALQCFGQGYEWCPVDAKCEPVSIPPTAVIGGHTACKQPIYIARACINGEWCVGKLSEGQSIACFPYGGKEVPLEEYDLLVYCP